MNLKKLFHKIFRWHYPSKYTGFDGCSFTSKCIFCNKKILKDSQGNWFTID